QQQKTRAKAADKAVKAAPKESVERTIHKKMLAKVHIAVNDLKRMLPEFNDETYRFILEMKFDVSSSKDLTSAQLHELLLHFQNLGWQQKQSGTTHSRKRKDVPLLAHDPTGLGREAQMRKIQALLLEKGNVEGREVSMNYALSILKRQTGGTVTSFEDALPKQLQGVSAALSQDAIRKGRRTK
ncbi:regulatory protein GemA, partial [Desulfovibrio sp.]|uniref:regulatory protein GemA n=1 Tax=Desulfovibrio sp. TaxID=885 RepID=UPI002627E96D